MRRWVEVFGPNQTRSPFGLRMIVPPCPGPENGALRKMYWESAPRPAYLRTVIRGGVRSGRDTNPAEASAVCVASVGSAADPLAHPLRLIPVTPAADAPASPNRRLRVKSSVMSRASGSGVGSDRSEEHRSELQSPCNL